MADDTTNALASGDPAGVANALGGGSPLPQADTMAIASRLLGPDLAQRYGDVIGARPSTLADVARDTAIGAISKDPSKADSIKMMVAKNYQQQLAQQQQLAAARDADNRNKIATLFSTLKGVKDVPMKYRKDFLNEAFTKLGIQTSPFATKILADPDSFKTDELTSPDMQALADSDPQKFLDTATQTLGDGQAAINLLKSLQGLKQQRQQTQDMITSATQRKAAADKAAAEAANGTGLWGAANDELAHRAASGGVGKYPNFQGMSDDQVRALGNQSAVKGTGAGTGSDELGINAQTILETIPKLRSKISEYWTPGAGKNSGIGGAIQNYAGLTYQKNVTIPNAKNAGELGEFDYLNSKVIPLIRVAGRGTKGLRITQAEFQNIGDAFSHPENYTADRLNSYLDAVQHDTALLVKEGKLGGVGGSGINTSGADSSEIAPGVRLRMR